MTNADSEYELSISAPGIPVATFKRAAYAAATAFEWEKDGIHLLEPSHRNGDPLVHVALVQMGTTALSALLTGLCTIAGIRISTKIVIVGRTGNRIELPGSATVAEIETCVQLLDHEPPKHVEIVAR